MRADPVEVLKGAVPAALLKGKKDAWPTFSWVAAPPLACQAASLTTTEVTLVSGVARAATSWPKELATAGGVAKDFGGIHVGQRVAARVAYERARVGVDVLEGDPDPRSRSWWG